MPGCRFGRSFIAILLCCVALRADAAWFDASWKFRRPIEAIWDAEHGSGEQLCFATFYTAGHMKPSGADVRVATEDGKLAASRVIDIKGDRVRVVFSLPKNERKFFVYFGNDDPQALPANAAELKMTWGLFMESKLFRGGRHDSPDELENAWERSGSVAGAAMIDRPFYGYNQAIEDERTISRISGNLYAAVEGKYLFAGAADDRAAIFIDGKPFLLIPGYVGDSRFNKSIDLTRGRHEFVVYHLDTGGECRLSVCWQPPGVPKPDVIPQEAFGAAPRGVVGALEELKKPMTADFTAEPRGEFFLVDRYLNRWRFTARVPKSMNNVQYEWDFGDGQTGTGSVTEHVFLQEGIFPIRCTFHVGSNSDTQTSKMIITRNLERATNPFTDDAKDQAKFAARYDLSKLPPEDVAHAVLLIARAGDTENALIAAGTLARAPAHTSKQVSLTALIETAKLAMNAGKTKELAALWEKIPPDSDLNPDITCEAADFFLWDQADFDRALKLMQPLKSNRDARLQSRYAQALLLNQRADEARTILENIPVPPDAGKQSAISGANARTIEFFIRDGDADAGEEAWEKWQSRAPADFLDGYSALLRVKLMEVRKRSKEAAKVAEAFANAVPGSSYSPTLLNEASRLLKEIDRAKSDELHALLKKRYPEHPLSQ